MTTPAGSRACAAPSVTSSGARPSSSLTRQVACGTPPSACPATSTIWCTHLNDLKAWSKFLGDLGTVAGAVALVAAVDRLPAGRVRLRGRRGRAVDVRRGRRRGGHLRRDLQDRGRHGAGRRRQGQLGRGRLRRRVGSPRARPRSPGSRAPRARSSGLEGQAGALETYAAGRESGLTASPGLLGPDQRAAALLRNSTVSLTSNPARLTTCISTTQGLAGRRPRSSTCTAPATSSSTDSADHGTGGVHDKVAARAARGRGQDGRAGGRHRGRLIG